MEDIEVDTNFAKPIDINKPKESNILFKPSFANLVNEDNLRSNKTAINQSSVLNRSSMMTYGKMYFFIFDRKKFIRKT
jgi:hypothetical protein